MTRRSRRSSSPAAPPRRLGSIPTRSSPREPDPLPRRPRSCRCGGGSCRRSTRRSPCWPTVGTRGACPRRHDAGTPFVERPVVVLARWARPHGVRRVPRPVGPDHVARTAAPDQRARQLAGAVLRPPHVGRRRLVRDDVPGARCVARTAAAHLHRRLRLLHRSAGRRKHRPRTRGRLPAVLVRDRARARLRTGARARAARGRSRRGLARVPRRRGRARGGDWLAYLDVPPGQPESSWSPLPTIRSHEPPGQRFPLAEIPHGKQSWYGPIGGLWQDVFLEMRPTDAIEHVLVTPAMDGDVSAHVELAYPLAEPGRLEATITSPDRWTTSRVHPEAGPAGGAPPEGLASVGAPDVRDLDEPNLYEIAVTLRTERSDDTWTDTFGFRSIETRDGHVVLNGRPVYLLGALDQKYYPPDDPAPSTSETFRQDVVAAKAMGLNLLRCHIKVPDPRYLRAADELGILVWEEIPNWLFLTDASRRRARETFAGMVRRDHNRPSVVIRSVINEGWGADLVREPDHRAWLSETTRWAHELDPTRLLVDNSACAPTFHLRSSLNDFHRYWALPDEHATMVRWLDDWIAAPASTFDANGTSERSGTEPLVLSEFGAWGLPDVANLLDPEGGEPWWFTTGEGWMHGAVVAEGIEDRFKAWGLDRAFGTWERFGRESREHQFESLRAQVEELRRRPQMAGYVVTQFTDVHWEVNGLLDGSRTPKMSPERLRAVNAPTLVLARPAALRARAGARMPVEVSVSHFSNADLDGCSVAWEADGRAGRLDGSVARATVTAVGSMDLEVAGTGPHTAWFSLLDRHGRLVHRTDATVWGFDDVTLATDEVIVADRWTHELAGRVAAGERCIVVASEPAALPSGSRL